MNSLEKLPEITERALDGLRADESLKIRILNASLQKEMPSGYGRSLRFVPVLLSSVALMIICVFLLNAKKPLLPNEDQHLIHSFSAGSSTSSAVSYDDFAETETDSFEAVELRSLGTVSDRVRLVQLITLLKEHSEPVSDENIAMNDQLGFFGSSGLLFSLPAESPYIQWSDGVRRCDSFCELYRRAED